MKSSVTEFLRDAMAGGDEARATEYLVLGVSKRSTLGRAKRTIDSLFNRLDKAVLAAVSAPRAAYAAWQDRLTWAKRTHQRAMMVKGVWTREAKQRRSKQPVASTPTGERIDLGALVIAAAFKYRFHRTKENAAALDTALDNIAIVSERWRTFRDNLR